jgi:glycosyltransferase involved in cell wall biosynthesis
MLEPIAADHIASGQGERRSTMTEGSKHARILLVGQSVEDFRHRTSRNSGLFAVLDDRYEIVGTIEPHVPRLEDYAIKLRYARPNRDAWRSRAGLSPWTFRRLTEVAEKQLRPWDGRYDLVMLVQTLFSPGLLSRNRRYAIYTDNIHILTARYFPAWAPLSRRDRAKRIRLEQATCRAARYVFAKTDFLRDALIEDYGCEPERVVRVGSGSNIMVHSLDGKRYDGQVALFVGIDFERKGGPILLQAWSAVRERLPDAELWLVGPKRRPAAAEQPGVRWHGFVSDRRQLAGLYERATLFVLPALFEPWGGVLMEARGHGLPCIGTDRGGFRESIDDGVNGLLVPADEPEPLADALVFLLGDPERAALMGRRGHAEVLTEHTWDRVADRMAPYIEQAAAEPTA